MSTTPPYAHRPAIITQVNQRKVTTHAKALLLYNCILMPQSQGYRSPGINKSQPITIEHRTEDKQLTAKQQKYLQLVVFLGLRIEEFNPLFYMEIY
jgi:hypothetical protein